MDGQFGFEKFRTSFRHKALEALEALEAFKKVELFFIRDNLKRISAFNVSPEELNKAYQEILTENVLNS